MDTEAAARCHNRNDHDAHDFKCDYSAETAIEEDAEATEASHGTPRSHLHQ